MKILKTLNQMIWYDESLLNEQPELCCDVVFWQQQNKIIGSAQGRGTTWFIEQGNLEAALRHYRRGGLFGKFIKDRYIFTDWQNTRCFQEYQLLSQLIDAGVNVPKPIAARASKEGFCYRADLLSQKIPNARDLVSILQEQLLTKEIYQKIGIEIAKMHSVQVNHTDLNIHNILIDRNQQVWIIDFDKCFQQNGFTWKDKNLSRLKRSFIKELKKKNIHWKEEDWLSLLAGYRSH